MFIHPTLTKIAQDGEKPTYTSIKLLRDELVSNAVSVPSNLRDRLNGHLFLVISEDGYTVEEESTLIFPACVDIIPLKIDPLQNRFDNKRLLLTIDHDYFISQRNIFS